jgi:hypothetical protein
MKYLSFLFLFLLAAACQQAPQHATHQKSEKDLASTGNFGVEFATDQAIPVAQVTGIFSSRDTAEAILSGKISSSCKHSGCWMDLDMGNGEELHVTFRDEAFTIPLDAAGKSAVARGIVVRELIPVETLQNYAREDGKSEEEVAAITEAVYIYELIADGVLIRE